MKTYLHFILDMSENMNQNTQINNFNHFLRKQQQLNCVNDTFITLHLFNNHYKILHNQTNIIKADILNCVNYIPIGDCHKYDVIVFTYDLIDSLIYDFEECKVAIVVVSSNNDKSRRYTKDDTQKIIQEHSYDYLETTDYDEINSFIFKLRN